MAGEKNEKKRSRNYDAHKPLAMLLQLLQLQSVEAFTPSPYLPPLLVFDNSTAVTTPEACRERRQEMAALALSTSWARCRPTCRRSRRTASSTPQAPGTAWRAASSPWRATLAGAAAAAGAWAAGPRRSLRWGPASRVGGKLAIESSAQPRRENRGAEFKCSRGTTFLD